MSLRDRLLSSDPPLERLRMAVRTLVAVMLGGAPLLALMRVAHLPGTSVLLGTLVAAWASFQANDVDPRARRITGALLPVVAAGAVTISTVLGSLGPVPEALGFLVVAFPAIWVRRFGPRGFGFGMMALLATFFTLFVQLRVADLAPTVAAIAVGGVASWIAHFLILPDSARLALRGAAIAFRARARLAGEAIEAGRPGPALLALNRAAVALDQLLASDAFVLGENERGRGRATLLDAQLAIERVAHGGYRRDVDAVVADGNARVTAAVQSALDAPTSAAADAPMSSGPKPPEIGGIATATRQAIQITVASAAAIAIGAAIPPHRYAWALLTAFIVYNRAASASEARRRAVARLAGTAVGVAIGLAATDALRGHAPVEIGIAIVGLFAAAYTFRASYFAFTLFITITIASLYDLVGRPADELLADRLVETIAGAFCGGIVASFVVPFRTADVVSSAAATFVEKLRACADACAAVAGAASPLSATRALDAQLDEFVDRAQPFFKPPAGSALHPVTADAIAIAARARAAAAAPRDPGAAAEMRRAGERLADEVETAVALGARRPFVSLARSGGSSPAVRSPR